MIDYILTEKEEVVRRWTAHGLDCAVIVNPFGGCNGYVKLPADRPAGWTTYENMPDVEVSGGLTYGPNEDGWVGFDTLHLGDWWSGQIRGGVQDELVLRVLHQDQGRDYSRAWDDDEVAAECEYLAEQLSQLLEYPA